jgi:intracellular sulfur oxidation DsrE/DsrF family protein
MRLLDQTRRPDAEASASIHEVSHAPAAGADAAFHSLASKPVTAQSETLRPQGLISLVCNIALGHWSARAAKRANRKAADVMAEARANLIPGAIVVPSGIDALIRAQNAGCAFMPGT